MEEVECRHSVRVGWVRALDVPPVRILDLTSIQNISNILQSANDLMAS